MRYYSGPRRPQMVFRPGGRHLRKKGNGPIDERATGSMKLLFLDLFV